MYSDQLDITQWTTAPLQITVTTRLNTSSDVAFQALSDPEMMCQLFSWMDNVTVAPSVVGGPLAVGVLRTCILENGLVLEEEIVAWHPPQGYAYRGIDATHPFGMRGHVSAISFVSHEDGCQIVWQHYFDHPNVSAMREQLKQSMNVAIDTLIRRFGSHRHQAGGPPRWQLKPETRG
ncbi:MAG: SRPBCC family protein [Chloroflexota bacterium]